MRAEDRLRYYASIFPLVEVDSTYYFPPTEDMVGLWVNRTPARFTMSVKAYSLLTGHPTRPDSLWPEVAEAVPLEHKEKRSVYLSHLPPAAVDEAWELFRRALMPLHSAGKLGTVLFQYPHWFRPKAETRAALAELPQRLPDYDCAVEFRHGSWLAEGERERTLSVLERHGLAFVCVDEPQGFSSSVPPPPATSPSSASTAATPPPGRTGPSPRPPNGSPTGTPRTSWPSGCPTCASWPARPRRPTRT
jgi:uncharacterized protein YecE (DUF72 family)